MQVSSKAVKPISRLLTVAHRDFQPSWIGVAHAWATAPKEQRDQHFFATADFDEASSIFQQVRICYVPTFSAALIYVSSLVYNQLLLFMSMLPQKVPVNKHRNPVHTNMTLHSMSNFLRPSSHHADIPGSGFDPLPLAESLSNHTPIPIPYKAPFNYGKWATIAFTGTAFALLLRFIAPVLQNRWTWAVVTIVTSLTMTSGYMFTRIRNSPFQGGGGAWISPGYQNQFGQEVQVIAMICTFFIHSSQPPATSV